MNAVVNNGEISGSDNTIPGMRANTERINSAFDKCKEIFSRFDIYPITEEGLLKRLVELENNPDFMELEKRLKDVTLVVFDDAQKVMGACVPILVLALGERAKFMFADFHFLPEKENYKTVEEAYEGLKESQATWALIDSMLGQRTYQGEALVKYATRQESNINYIGFTGGDTKIFNGTGAKGSVYKNTEKMLESLLKASRIIQEHESNAKPAKKQVELKENLLALDILAQCYLILHGNEDDLALIGTSAEELSKLPLMINPDTKLEVANPEFWLKPFSSEQGLTVVPEKILSEVEDPQNSRNLIAFINRLFSGENRDIDIAEVRACVLELRGELGV